MLALGVALLLLAGWALTVPGLDVGRRMPAALMPAALMPAARMPAARVRHAWRPRRPWRRKPSRSSDVARVLVEVAARLRAGSPMAAAWQRSLPTPVPMWAQPVLAEVGGPAVAATARGPTRRRWYRRVRRPQQREAADVAAAVAACRLAGRTGAPLAEVVDVVVGGIAEAAEAVELRRTALAGPRATARLLAWLPAGGVVLGTALGADPLGVLLGGGLGGLCLVGGAALSLVGRRWVAALVADAERAGR